MKKININKEIDFKAKLKKIFSIFEFSFIFLFIKINLTKEKVSN